MAILPSYLRALYMYIGLLRRLLRFKVCEVKGSFRKDYERDYRYLYTIGLRPRKIRFRVICLNYSITLTPFHIRTMGTSPYSA